MEKKKEISYKEIRQIKVSEDSYVGLVEKKGFSTPREVIFWTDCTPWSANSLLSCKTNEAESDILMDKIEKMSDKTIGTVLDELLDHIILAKGKIRHVDMGWKGIHYVCEI